MFKKTLLATVLAATSFSSLANWNGGISYINISEEAEGLDLSLGVLAGSLGYKYQINNNFEIMPELRLGFGVSDDSVRAYSTDIKVEVKTFTSLSVRGQYSFDDNLYVFAAPAYSNLDVEFSAGGNSASEDEWEFGFNAGLGYQITDTSAVELSFEDFDGTDLLSVGIRASF